MTIKPIRNDENHREALREIEGLWGAPLGTPKGDRLDVLIALVESYEREHHAIAPPDPISAIRFRLEQAGLDQSALVGIIGSRTRVYEVLQGQRQLTLPMIRRLHKELGVPAESLISEVPRRRRAA